MQKIVLAMLFAFGLLGCGTKEYYTVLVTNESPKKASYDYDGNSDILEPDESKTYEVKAYTQPPKNIVDENGIASLAIKLDNMTGNYRFNEADSLDLKVENKLPSEITIKAGNYIDNNGSMEVKIAKNGESTGVKIYTRTLQFTATTDYPYPINVKWTIDGKEMSVIIIVRQL